MPPAKSHPCPHSTQLSAAPACVPAFSTALLRYDILRLTLNSDPQQKKCRLVTLQYILCDTFDTVHQTELIHAKKQIHR